MGTRVQYVQARRITCGWCDQPFSYVLEGVTGSALPGVLEVVAGGAPSPLLSLFFQTEKADLSGPAYLPCAGEALCPHCHCWQLWMFATGGVARSRPFLYASPFVAALAVFALCWLLPGLQGIASVLWFALTVFSMIAIARLASPPRRPKALVQDQDPRAFTDEELDEWLVAHRQEGVDPILQWARACGLTKPVHSIPRSLGLLDLTGENRHPHLATERKLAPPGGR